MELPSSVAGWLERATGLAGGLGLLRCPRGGTLPLPASHASVPRLPGLAAAPAPGGGGALLAHHPGWAGRTRPAWVGSTAGRARSRAADAGLEREAEPGTARTEQTSPSDAQHDLPGRLGAVVEPLQWEARGSLWLHRGRASGRAGGSGAHGGPVHQHLAGAGAR